LTASLHERTAISTFFRKGGGDPTDNNEFIASGDAIVIGRKTFKKVLTLGACPMLASAWWSRAAARSICPRPSVALSNQWPGLRLKSFRNLLLVVFSTSMWKVESRFNAEPQGDSAEWGSFKNLRQGALR
jgi:hypothetical protein